MSNSWK